MHGKITLLVDKINERNEWQTPGDALHSTLMSSDSYYEKEHSWDIANRMLLLHLTHGSSFEIVLWTDYDPQLHKNPYYLISQAWMPELLNPILWHMISPDCKSFLRQRSIPILIFFPFEVCNQQISTIIENVNQTRHSGLGNCQVLLLSLTSFFNATTNQPYQVPGISCVSSILFLHQQEFNTRPILGVHWHNPTQKKKLFLCLNNHPRLSRQLLLKALQLSNLYEYGIVSNRAETTSINLDSIILLFQQENSETSNPDIKDLLEQEFNLTRYQEKMSVNESLGFFKLLLSLEHREVSQILIDDFTYVQQEWSPSWYKESWCSIITETFIEIRPGVTPGPIITEKTLKPILNFHPFVIFGHAYSHTFLQSLGFKTFEQSWFGLPADGEVGNKTLLERTTNLIESLKRLSMLTNEELTEKWKQIKPDLVYNQELLKNTDWARVQRNLIQTQTRS